MELWSSNKRREGGSGPAVEVLVDSLIVALVAIRKRIHVSVVEEAFGSISPGELLQGGQNRILSVCCGLPGQRRLVSAA